MSSNHINSVFYAESYHPIQAGSIDGTDVLPHDNAIYRALLCSSAGLYDPFGDPKATGDPYCTVFVGRLSCITTEETLHKVMSKYGRVKNLRLVRDIVTGASRGYAFVEYGTEKEMQRAYKAYHFTYDCRVTLLGEQGFDVFHEFNHFCICAIRWKRKYITPENDAHHSVIDDCEIIVDYSRQQLMPGWIPRRLGGGLGGRKESGQLRFGGRERPFRAPLRPIPYDELERLGIPPPPEGRYMSRFQVPSPPRRERNPLDEEDGSNRRHSKDRMEGSLRSSVETERHYERSSTHRDGSHRRSSSERKGEKAGHSHRISAEKEQRHRRSSLERGEHTRKRKERDEHSHRQHKHGQHSCHDD